MKSSTNPSLVPAVLSKSMVAHDTIADLCEGLFGNSGAQHIKVDAIIAAAPKIRAQLADLRREQRRLRSVK